MIHHGSRGELPGSDVALQLANHLLLRGHLSEQRSEHRGHTVHIRVADRRASGRPIHAAHPAALLVREGVLAIVSGARRLAACAQFVLR